MNQKARVFFIGLCVMAAVLLASASAQETGKSTAAAAPTVRTASGIVRGVTESDLSSFKGIPYAAAPVGAFRWRPPQPMPAWQGERDASQFGLDCAQRGFGPGSASIRENSSEDCLFLNVWKPAGAAPGAKLPVMVWIHGGAFVFGSGSQPDLSAVQFARQGIILVTFNSPSMQGRMRYGAAHASEIPYVFDNLRGRNGAAVAPKDQEVAKMMNAYWANFAKTGDPNGPGLPKWPRYDPSKDEILEFRPDGSPTAEPDPRKARLDVIEKAAKAVKPR
jgi:carboxylesterase type B